MSCPECKCLMSETDAVPVIRELRDGLEWRIVCDCCASGWHHVAPVAVKPKRQRG